MKRTRGLIYLMPLLLAGCVKSEPPDEPQAGGDGSRVDAGSEANQGGGGDRDPGPIGATDGDDTEGCLTSSTTAEIASQSVENIDVLFMVDNSGSMREEQAALREQFPRLINALTTGDRDGDGMQDVPRAGSLHLGVVSSDMGLVGIEDIEKCSGLGDDGIMQNTPSPEVTGCQASYPRFLSFIPDLNDPTQTAVDFACISTLGTDGCGFEQQLESTLKALWPSIDIDPASGQLIDPNRIQFLGDPNGFGTLGHGDSENAGFLRNDPVAGLSAIAVVVVSDEEDCSSADTSHFTPSHFLDPNDPLTMQDLNLRCFFNKQNLYPVERYINGLQALRPGNENLVLFSAIVGVPPDLVTPESYAAVDWQDDAARNAFYDQILNDVRMQEVVDTSRLPEQGGNLLPSCNTERGKAYPPLRLVEVARGFGQNGVVQSICQEDFGPAIDAIVERIGSQLGAPCLPRPVVRSDDGLIDCQVIWELPPAGMAPASTPVGCGGSGYDFLSEPIAGPPVTARGGAICTVRQLAVENRAVQPTAGGASGWYYDDFSEEVASECLGGSAQRIAYTPEAKPPTGVVAKLSCLTEQGESCGDKPAAAPEVSVGDACLPDVVPEGGFQDSEAYVSSPSGYCGGGACLVFRLRGDPRENCTPIAPSPDGQAGRVCASPREIEDRVYCSCRCDAPDGFDECDCPTGFSCFDVLAQGSDAVRGGYCVRNGTFTGGS